MWHAAWFASTLRARRLQTAILRSVPEALRARAPPFERQPCRSTPGALAPVRVMLSRAIVTYSAPSVPLAGTPCLHHMVAYTRCPRCAFRPRRPASGSVLSLLVPSRHAVLSDPGELVGDFRPPASPTTLAFASLGQTRRSHNAPTIRFRWAPRFRGFTGSHLLQPVEWLASLADPTGFPQPQRRLRPGFRHVGHPPHRRI